MNSASLTNRAQSGMGFAAPSRLIFSDVLRAGFAT